MDTKQNHGKYVGRVPSPSLLVALLLTQLGMQLAFMGTPVISA